MANIDTNQHGLHRGHLVWELDVVEVAANLGVDLLQNVGCLGEVEAEGVPDSDYLGGDLVLLVKLLVVLVDAFIAKHHDEYDWVAQIVSFGEVVLDLLLQLVHVCLVLKFEPGWLLNLHAKHFLSLHEAFVNVVCGGEVASELSTGLRWALVAHDPLALLKVNGLLDR